MITNFFQYVIKQLLFYLLLFYNRNLLVVKRYFPGYISFTFYAEIIPVEEGETTKPR